ncbi:MAG: PKD domain-containing protein [Baekduia sp.]
MKAQHTLIRFAVIAVSALAAVPATASAGIWTPVASGTTANITAIDHVNAGTLVYGTASGQILKNGSVKSTNIGFSINDIAFNPSGAVGLATASNGRLLISTNGGDSWAVKSLDNTSYAQPAPICDDVPNPPLPSRTYDPTGNLNAVSWASDTVAYVAATDEGVIEKTVNGGTTWVDVSRQADGTCFVDTGGDIVTDVQAVPGSDLVWLVDTYFGTRYISSNALASSALQQGGDSAVNCYDQRPRLALDFDNPNRAFVSDRCSGTLALGFTENGGDAFDLSQDYLAGDGSSLTGLNDVAIAGGSAMAVGNGGAILVDNDGRSAYFPRADGANRTNDWFSVDKLNATTAAIGGRNGVLLTTAQATTIPDIVEPAGTISGATTVVAGTPATFTANVADEAGGSGIDPASFVWTATGVPTATGNPVTLTFPSAGYYSVKVSFKDLAGNAGTASLSVTVNAPPVVKPPPPVKPTKTTTASVPGAKISFGVPNTCVKAGSTFKVTLTWKKQRRKGNKFVKVRRADFYIGSKRVKIDKKAPFTQTLKVKAGTKAGSTITVKARAFVKVTKGKSPTKSISSKIKVCS